MKTDQSLSRFECIRIQSRNYAIQRVIVAVTHPGSDHTGGFRLANVPNVEGLMTAACCCPATVSGLVSVTRMTSLAFPSSYYLQLNVNSQRTFQVQYVLLLVRHGMHVKAEAFARTVFALDVPQELRDSPLQNDHFDWRYALGLQSTINSCSQSFLLIRGYQDPSCPLLVSVGELLRFLLRYELFSSAPRLVRYDTLQLT